MAWLLPAASFAEITLRRILTWFRVSGGRLQRERRCAALLSIQTPVSLRLGFRLFVGFTLPFGVGVLVSRDGRAPSLIED
ncbi:MAG: hypothetical protein KF861_11810 [Planctomycetaceae bacterium]|nr:hypothetical protein [Planctomycetaceae bacterium]